MSEVALHHLASYDPCRRHQVRALAHLTTTMRTWGKYGGYDLGAA
jgi:hypothetical protein